MGACLGLAVPGHEDAGNLSRDKGFAGPWGAVEEDPFDVSEAHPRRYFRGDEARRKRAAEEVLAGREDEMVS